MKKHYDPTTVEVIMLSQTDVLTASTFQPVDPGTTEPTYIPTIPNAPDDPDLLEPMP